MKNEKKELFVTEISLEDFLALNLVGYENRKHYFRKKHETENSIRPEQEVLSSDTGEWVKDSTGRNHWVTYDDVYSRILWDEVHLNDIVLENIKFSKEQGWNAPICVAIHEEVFLPEEEFRKLENYEVDFDLRKEKSLYESAYLDKYLTRAGMQTYLIRCGIKHLYSKRNYFYTTDGYFQVDKRETKAIYLIHWN